MVKLQVGLLSAAVVLAALASAQGQESRAAPSPYFDCPYVNYFDKDCPQLRKLWEEQERRRLQQESNPVTAPRDHDAGRHVEQPEQDDGPDSLGADETYLLFPKESLAPDAPPLFRLLLAEPTIDNARRYVRWYARRTARLQAVQALIQRAGSELEAEAKAGGAWQ